MSISPLELHDLEVEAILRATLSDNVAKVDLIAQTPRLSTETAAQLKAQLVQIRDAIQATEPKSVWVKIDECVAVLENLARLSEE